MKVYGFDNILSDEIRKSDYSSSSLAKAIEVNKTTISVYERGLNFPKIPVFQRICELLKVPADLFFINSDKRFMINAIMFYINKIDGNVASEKLEMVINLIYGKENNEESKQ